MIFILTIIMSFQTAFAEPKLMWGKQKKRNTASVEKIKEVKRKQRPVRRGNLPSYARAGGSNKYRVEKTSTITDNSYYVNRKVGLGDEYKLSINNVLNAVEGEKTSVTGTILEGPLMGYNVSGVSTLDKYSESIQIEFNKLENDKGQVFSFNGQGLYTENALIKPTKYVPSKSNWPNWIKFVLATAGVSFLESKVEVNNSLLGPNNSNNFKSSSYKAASDGGRVIANKFSDALSNGKDIAFILDTRIYKIRFLTNPKITIK